MVILSNEFSRVATVRESSLENDIFSKSGKSQGNLDMSQGNLEKNRKSQGISKFPLNCKAKAVF